jgi:hypothetical protein
MDEDQASMSGAGLPGVKDGLANAGFRKPGIGASENICSCPVYVEKLAAISCRGTRRTAPILIAGEADLSHGPEQRTHHAIERDSILRGR